MLSSPPSTPQPGSTESTTARPDMLAQFASGRPTSRSVPNAPNSGSKLKRKPRVSHSNKASSPGFKKSNFEESDGAHDKNIHRMSTQNSRTIRAAHIIRDCAAIIKELVENALDAHATRIEVRVRGIAALESITVSDNGVGIPPESFDALCLSSTTSKLTSMDDLQRLSTFGFRGEALSAIRAIASSVTILTRTAQHGTATSLNVAEDGSILSKSVAARPVGTTVTVRNVFHTLPVRRKDALQNASREIARCVSVVQSLAIISIHTKLDLRVASDLKVSSAPSDSSPETDFTLSAVTLESIRVTARSILGHKTASSLISVIDEQLLTVHVPPAFRGDDPGQINATYACHALVSSAALNADGKGGRVRSTHQFVYINKRPVDLPRLTRAANEAYRTATGLSSASPALIIALTLPSWACDVNLAPDKRRVLLHDEDELISAFVAMLERAWKPTTVNSIPVQSVQSTLTDSLMCNSLPLAAGFALDRDELSQNPITPPQKRPRELIDIDTLSDYESAQKRSPQTPSPRRPVLEPSTSTPELDLSRALDANIPNSQDGIGTLCTFLPLAPSNVEPTQCNPIFSRGDDQSHHNREGEGNLADSNTPMEASLQIQSTLTTPGFSDRFRRPRSQELSSQRHKRKRTFDKNQDELGSSNILKNFLSQVNDHLDVPQVSSARQRFRDLAMRPKSGTRDVTKFFASRATPSEIPLKDKPMSTKCVHDSSVGSQAEFLHGPEMGRNVSAESLGASRENSTSSTPLASVSNDGENVPRLDEDVSIELDGPSEIVHGNAVRAEATPVINIDWNKICEAMPQVIDTSGNVKIEDEVKEHVADFLDASVAPGQNGSNEQGAADRELSRLFRQEWFKELRVIGQFNLGFVIGRLHDDLFIIDQHASDEKFNFEQLQLSTAISKQKLVTSLQLEFSTEDELLVYQHLHALRAGGFDLVYDENACPTKRFSLVSQPASKHTVFVENDLKDIVDGLRNEMFSKNVKILRPPRVRAMFASRACRMSIMVGTALHKRQMQKVVRNLADIEHPWTCPHGRPTMRHLCTLH